MAKPEWFFGDIRYQHFERDNITLSELRFLKVPVHLSGNLLALDK